MSDVERGTVRCSCGTVWLNVTLAEAEQIGRTHDDSPGMSHVVSSLLFTDSAKRARATRAHTRDACWCGQHHAPGDFL